MRNVLFAAIVVCAVLFVNGCGNAVFAPSLRDTAPQAQPLPWWNESGPDSVDTTAPVEPTPRSDYPSPLQVGDMIISHSGLWQLTSTEEAEDGTVAFLRSDQDWHISIVHLRSGSATASVQDIQEETEGLLTFVAMLTAQGMMQDPEILEQVPEGMTERELLGILMEMVVEMNGIYSSPLDVAEHTPDAASYTVTVQGRTTVVYGMCTDFSDPNTAVVVMGDWPEDAGPLPLTELTEIAHNLRITPATEAAPVQQ